MITLLLASAALALPPCPEDVVNDLNALDSALKEIEGPLRKLVPSTPDIESFGRAYVRDDGDWVAINTSFDSTCLLGDTEVAVRSLWPMPGGGSMSIFETNDQSDQVLAVGTHDEARDHWDKIGWQSIIAHEWQHVRDAKELGDDFPDIKLRSKLIRTYRKKKKFKQATVEFTSELAGPCKNPNLLPAYDAYQGALSKKLQLPADHYAVIEGHARYVEVQYEALVRGKKFADEVLIKACSPVQDAEFGYAIGCLLTHRIDRCAADHSLDPLRTPVREIISSTLTD